ncbi:MAG: TIGR04282 family arsenosugar biosynthesis glycosyltransferase [Clostridiaceae bacterium]
MKTALAIFCKTPGISPVKTRLASEIGKKQAETFYSLSISAIKEVATAVKEKSGMEVVPYWAVAEKQSVNNHLWDSFETVWTGEGGLGDRIFNVFDKLFQKYNKVIIIGSDSPQISSQYILDTAKRLTEGADDGVIGPCEDGGFVLFGSKVPVEKSVWNSVEYSKDSTLLQLTGKLGKQGFKYSYLPEMSDVDNYNDLKRLYHLLILNGKYNLPVQNELMGWISNIIWSKNNEISNSMEENLMLFA